MTVGLDSGLVNHFSDICTLYINRPANKQEKLTTKRVEISCCQYRGAVQVYVN